MVAVPKLSSITAAPSTATAKCPRVRAATPRLPSVAPSVLAGLVDVSRWVHPMVVLDPATTEFGSGVAQAARAITSAEASIPVTPRSPLRGTVISHLWSGSLLPEPILRAGERLACTVRQSARCLHPTLAGWWSAPRPSHRPSSVDLGRFV